MERSHNCLECRMRTRFVFCNLPSAALQELERIGGDLQLRRGAILFSEDDPCDSVRILCSGRVKLSATTREGRAVILRIARPGEVLGLSSALESRRHEVTAEALEPCRLKVIRRRELLNFLDSQADAGIRSARVVAREYEAAFRELRRLALPATVSGRLAALLLDWSREQSPHDGVLRPRILMTLTHDEIASMTATSRETVTRILGQFRRDKLISVEGISLTLLQPGTLERLAA